MYCPNPECPHAQDTGEPAEYRAGFDRCRDCGAELVEARPSFEDDSVEWEAFVPVVELTNAALVPFVESLLRGDGIRYFIKGERVQDFFGWGRFGSGFNIITGPPVVFVEPGRAAEAKELLANLYVDFEEAEKEED